MKYKTFSTLLIQNLQKGSRRMADILEQEALEAWDERKRKARVLGEAAATKLLVPMVMMLAVFVFPRPEIAPTVISSTHINGSLKPMMIR